MKEMLYDFSLQFIAAFLGFLFAILLDRMNSRREERNKQKMILLGIQNELRDISTDAAEYLSRGVVLRHRIATPTWDSLQYAGGVLSLMDKPFYDSLVGTYSMIKIFNEERREMEDKELQKWLSEIRLHSEKLLAEMEREVTHVKNTKS